MTHLYSPDLSKMKGFNKILNLGIRWFTHFEYPGIPWKQGFSHSSLGENQLITGEKIIFESSVSQKLSFYDYPQLTVYLMKDQMRINDPIIFTDIAREEIGKPYAFLQLADFIRVWAYNKILKKDPENVWFPNSSVCSEQSLRQILREADKYDLEHIRNKFLQYNTNFYSPMRLYRIFKELELSGDAIIIDHRYPDSLK